jgi:hydroxymethylpyrimidine pyrophosphatase-like HAD family hydrolase
MKRTIYCPLCDQNHVQGQCEAYINTGKSIINTKIIALDYDGCIVDKYGYPILKNVFAIRKEIEKGTKVILWTCRCGDKLDEAIRFCDSLNISLSAINENLLEIRKYYNNNSRKIYADEYWDDKAVLKNDKIINNVFICKIIDKIKSVIYYISHF